MMGAIRDWLMGVSCAAMFLSAAEILMPKGRIRQLGRFAGAVVLLLVTIYPIIDMDEELLDELLTGKEHSASEYEETLGDANAALYKSIIENNAAAYIQDKAAAMGVICRAEAKISYSQDGDAYISEVYVVGTWTETQRAELGCLLESELQVPKERLHFERADE